MAPSEEAEAPAEEQEQDVKLALVRPEALTEEAIREAAERLYTALTGKVQKVTIRRRLDEGEPDKSGE